MHCMVFSVYVRDYFCLLQVVWASVEERGGARAAAHPSRTVVADMIVTAMLYFVYFVITMLY